MILSFRARYLAVALACLAAGIQLQGQAGGDIAAKYLTISPGSGHTDVQADFRNLPYRLGNGRDGSTLVVAPECERSDAYGEPDLPLIRTVVYLPDDTSPESVRLEVLSREATHLRSGVVIRPVTPGYIPPEELSGPAIYGGRISSQSTPVVISRPFPRDGRIAVLLTFRPFQYDPSTGTLELVATLEARISYKTVATGTHRIARQTSPDPRWSGLQWSGLQKRTTASRSESAADSGYVIITTKKTVDSSARLGDFVSFKRSQGYAVTVATEEDYGVLTGQAPDGIAERIRQWLINNYEPLALRYLLLIGDPSPGDPEIPSLPQGDVPMKMLYPRSGDSWYMGVHAAASDFYYADLTGNWDLDGDGLFGEQRSNLEPTSPDPRIDPETFSIRWTGYLNTTDTTGIRIAAFYDDGCRMWIDSQLVFDHWQDQMAGLRYVDIPGAGMHAITIEYYQNKQNAFFRLFKGAIGAGWLMGLTGWDLFYWNDSAYVRGGLNAIYYNDKELTDSVFTRVDPGDENRGFDFLWLSGDRGEGGVDFTAELSVGRIPVYNENYADLDSILSKTIRYESSADTSWRRSALLAMRPFDDFTPNYNLGEQMRNEFLVPAGCSTFRMYNENYGCLPPPEAIPCTEENMLSAWREPFGLTAIVTHGAGDLALDILRSDSCHRLPDGNPAVVISGACNNGYPEQQNNLGMALLRRGAVGTFTASRISFYGRGNFPVDPENRLVQGITYHLARNILANHSLGQALDSVRSISANGASNIYWMNLFVTNLYGDPSLSLFPKTASGATGVILASEAPEKYELCQNYPNPFNASTTISYQLPARTHVNIELFNTLGQKVAELLDEEKGAGYHDIWFDGSNLASGVYVFRLRAGGFTQSRKFVLLR